MHQRFRSARVNPNQSIQPTKSDIPQRRAICAVDVSLADGPSETMILHLLKRVLGRFRKRWESLGRAVSRWTKMVAVVAVAVMLATTAVASATEWTSQGTPRLAHELDALLTAVSCSSPTACIAVGNELRKVGAPITPLAERFNGARWTRLLLPREPPGELKAVSCSSSSSCLAVGLLEIACNVRSPTPNCTSPLTEHFNGRRWTVVPAPAHAEGSFSSVSCAGASVCIAIGETADGSPLADRFDGRNLTAIPLPSVLPSSAEGIVDKLASVSCTSPTACTAVGNEVIFWLNPNAGGEGGALPGASDLPLAEHWNGSTWNAEAFPASLGWSTGASAVSCAAEGRCVAIGQTRDSVDQIASFDGSNWIAEPVTLQELHGSSEFSALSCPSSTACTLAGAVEVTGASRRSRVAILSFNGKRWRSQRLPAAVTAQRPELTGLSCLTTSFCVAVGDTNHRPVVLRWSGGR